MAAHDKGLLCFSAAGGTAGDVRPLLALALAMRARGFEILFAGNRTFERMALRAGLAASEWFASSEIPLSFWLRTTSGQRWLWGRRRRYRDWWFRREHRKYLSARSEAFWRRVGGPDNPRIVAAIGSISATRVLKRFGPRCARIVSGPMPYQPSTTFTLDPPDLSRLERWRGAVRGAWLARSPTYAGALRQFREDLFHLVSVSPSIFPRPPDWLPNMQVTGYTPLADSRAGEAVPATLREFLTDGPPPVYVGFGSYPFFFGARGDALARTIVEGCRYLNVRCLIHSPDVSPSLATREVFVLDRDVPHAWLFPRCAAVVHHGGYGTLHAALIARRPMVTYPFQTDQFLWAGRMGELGAGPGFTARLRDVSAERLAVDLASVLGRRCRGHAERIGSAIATDRGLEVQVEAVESIVEHTRRGRPPLAWRMPRSADAPPESPADSAIEDVPQRTAAS